MGSLARGGITSAPVRQLPGGAAAGAFHPRSVELKPVAAHTCNPWGRTRTVACLCRSFLVKLGSMEGYRGVVASPRAEPREGGRQ